MLAQQKGKDVEKDLQVEKSPRAGDRWHPCGPQAAAVQVMGRAEGREVMEEADKF